MYDAGSGVSNPKGKLISVSSSVSTYSYSGYDAAGRVTGGSQTLGSQSYALSYGYDLAGHVKSITYPSGRTANYSYDAAGRLNDYNSQLAFTGNLGDGVSRTYSQGLSYDAASRLKKEKFGTATPIYNKLWYNSRGQLAEIRASTSYTGPTDTTFDRGAIINHYNDSCWGMCYNLGTNVSGTMPDNNGNLKKQEVYVPNNDPMTSSTTWYQQYDYDNLNRLQRVHEYTGNTSLDWQQEYAYDRYGNRTIDGNVTKTFGNGVNSVQAAVSTATNRMYAPGETDANHPLVDYDAAGNQTKDLMTAPGVVNGTRVYDAENRLTIAKDASANQIAAYSYDANGQRVKRTVAGQPEVWQVYGMGGELLAEYAANTGAATPLKEYGYRNGQLLITAEAPARTNVALAANGATASSSSSLNANFPAAAANNGDRKGTGWGSGGGWADSSSGSFPDWLQVDFNGSKTINEVDVFTVQDNYASPSEPTETMTFSTYGLSGYEVQYWNGAAWVTVTGGSISGNNKIWKKISFTAVTTSKIRVLTNAAIDNGYSRITEVEAWAGPPPGNVVLAANGGVASASSTLSGFPPSGTNNGDRKGTNWGSGGGWADSTSGSFPDWLQIEFNGSKSIDEVDVFTLQNNYASPAEPTEAMTFSSYGLTGFEVQYWNGTAWVTVTGGSVTGNNKVWRKITFAAVTTNKIRVLGNAAIDNGYSRITEVEAWESATSIANLNWLVTDQLGTPRMVFDQSGSLATVKRHDYAPFGEELANGARPTTSGYSSGDAIRQKFTSKERDIETGLDYFLARYYSSTQGRFTSPDEFTGGPDELYDFAEDASNNPTFYAELENPQSINKYQYTYNNPLRYTDPTGHCVGVLRIVCTPAGQRAIERYGQRAIERATPYVATVVGAVAGAVARMGEGAAGDPSCPACDGMSNTLEFYRRDNEAAARSQDNSGNQGGSPQRGSGNPATAEADKNNSPYGNTPANRERMQQGKPPIGKDGKPVEIHHEGQKANGPVREMTRTDHRGKGNFGKNHPNKGPSQIDRNQAARDRRKHWKEKAKE